MSTRTRAKKSTSPNRRTTLWLWAVVGGGLLLVIAAMALALNGTGGSASGAPKLAVDRQEVDLGDVKLGTPVTVSFTLTNSGDGPLTFTRLPFVEVKEGC